MNIQIFGTKNVMIPRKPNAISKGVALNTNLVLIKYIADEDKMEEILENSQVIKTLIVRNGKQSTIEYLPDMWKDWY